jgi:hypothetical protein
MGRPPDWRLQTSLETFCRERLTLRQSSLQIIVTPWAGTPPREPLGFRQSSNDFLGKLGMLTKYANNPDVHRLYDSAIPTSLGELKQSRHQYILLS